MAIEQIKFYIKQALNSNAVCEKISFFFFQEVRRLVFEFLEKDYRFFN